MTDRQKGIAQLWAICARAPVDITVAVREATTFWWRPIDGKNSVIWWQAGRQAGWELGVPDSRRMRSWALVAFVSSLPGL